MSFAVTAITLFPEMFPGPLGHSIPGRALEEGLWSINTINPRDFATDIHKSVDDKPYGGGAGMVMKPEIAAKAMESFDYKQAKCVYLSPRGRLLNQRVAEELAGHQHLAILCGRYEGVDQRIIEEFGMEEISVGDYVLSGGEIAAYVLIDACVRLLSGVLGNAQTLEEESFSAGSYTNLLEYEHYTRPPEWRGKQVPEVLLSGNHEAIAKWRLKQATEITKARRPDLLK